MNERVVWLSISEGVLQFYTDGFYWEDLGTFIPPSETVKVLLLVCSDKEMNSFYIDNYRCSDEMEQFIKQPTLNALNDYIINNKLRVEEFELLLSNGITISQPMWDDLLFTDLLSEPVLMEEMMIKSGLSRDAITYLLSHLGKFTYIDKGGNILSEVVPGFNSLEDYLEYKYEMMNREINQELNL